MPKLKKERATSKLHTSASAKPAHSSSGSASSGGWSVSASKKKKKQGRNGASAGEEIAVEEEDLIGLDIESAAHESEASKRAAVADALKDLIAMGDEDDDDEDDSDDEAIAAFGGMGDDGSDDDTAMDARQPMKGSLQVQAKKAIAVAKRTPVASSSSTTAAAAPITKLEFAPSAPQRHSAAALVASARAAVAAAAAAPSADPSVPALPAKIQASKADKRTLKHDRLMSRLALPGTAAAMAKRNKSGGSFQNLRQLGQELNISVLTPTQQNAIALLQQKQAAKAAAGASDKRDVLFLTDEGDKERLKQLQKQINEVKERKAVAVPRAAVAGGAQAAANAAASGAAVAPAVAAPAITPSPFLPQKNLTKAGRSRQHASELAQFAAVLHHPQFQQAPLQSLQLHLQNSAMLAKLQQEAAGIQVMEATQPKKQMSGSQKKKNKAAAARRAQIMQQANSNEMS